MLISLELDAEMVGAAPDRSPSDTGAAEAEEALVRQEMFGVLASPIAMGEREAAAPETPTV